MNFFDLLDNNETITEDVKTSIKEAFEAAVEKKVSDRVDLEITSALTELDEKHAVQLEELIQAIDDDHSTKLQDAINHIDSDHTTKLKKVIKHYEQVISSDSAALHEQITDDISNFLDLYLDQVVPVEEIKQATQNTRASNIVESIKQLVSVDEKYINDNIREALVDGKQQIDKLHTKLNESIKENIDLQSEMHAMRSKIMISEKTESMPAAKKAYVQRVLGDKSPTYIESNFDYVVEMFEKDGDERRVIVESQQPKEAVAPRVQSKTEKVDTPKVILEENTQPADLSVTAGYLDIMAAQERRIPKS